MHALNDYECAVCGVWQEHWADDTCRPTHCGQPMVWAPSRPPAVDAYEPFQQFTTDVNGVRTTIGSLSQLRQIERLTEQQARNGEGAPMVWRDYSNDRSNFDRHTLAPGGNILKPVDGYAGEDKGPVKVDPSIFRPRKGSDVTTTHGTI
jgi:hypothetical protein